VDIWDSLVVIGTLVVLVLAAYVFFKSLGKKEGALAGLKKAWGILFRNLP
jgi:hypothetical protein